MARIEHIVVLMLENRSFDHSFGFRPGVHGLQGTETILRDPANPNSTAFQVGPRAPTSYQRANAKDPAIP